MTEVPDELQTRFQAGLHARMPMQLERMSWDAERIHDHQQEALRRLLAHAIEHSPFHASRLAGIDPKSFELSNLSSLPTMSKAQMMAAFDEVVSDRRLALSDVQAHLKQTREYPRLLQGERFAVATGGSSGLKGVFVYDRDAMVNFGSRLMASGGRPRANQRVVAAIGSPSAMHILRLGFSLVSGGPLQVVHAPVTLPLGEIVRRLNESQPDVLFGYPTVLHRLALEQESGRLSIRPSKIRCGAETLTVEAESRIAAAFGAPIVDTYGATEGLLGVRLPGQRSFAFASDLAIVELVDEQHQPVPAGTPSAKVLLTNLFNLAQPLIRYELEDSFVQRPAATEHGHLIASVQGRAIDFFRYGSVCVHPLTVLAAAIWAPAVVDYQIRQTASGIEANLSAHGHLDTAALTAEIELALGRAGLPNPQVSVRLVESLDRDPATGKHRRIIPLSSGELGQGGAAHVR